jgi:3'(2'), 5'-bisphosphate nucleotidase
LGTAVFLHVHAVAYDICQDHAPGCILVEEAGGTVTDSRGEPLNFGLGRTLGENFGVVAAGNDVHTRVLAAVQRVLRREQKV